MYTGVWMKLSGGLVKSFIHRQKIASEQQVAIMFDSTILVIGGEKDACINLAAFVIALAFNHDDVAHDAVGLVIFAATVSDVAKFDAVGGGKFDSRAAVFQVGVGVGGQEGDFDMAQDQIRPWVGDFDAQAFFRHTGKAQAAHLDFGPITRCFWVGGRLAGNAFLEVGVDIIRQMQLMDVHVVTSLLVLDRVIPRETNQLCA